MPYSSVQVSRACRAHGGDDGGVPAAVRQCVDAPGAQVILVQQLLVPGKAEIGYLAGGEDALVTDVVDGEQRARAGEQRLRLEAGAQEQRRERRVPVVAVNDLRRPLRRWQAMSAARVSASARARPLV
jgi:hypothetical protein